MTSGRKGEVNDERGSILVAALALTFVLTLLGFALFDLATLDNRLALGNEAEYRALEIAESGLESAMYQLFLDVCGDPSCTSPPDPSNQNWADGAINGTSFPVTTASFANFIPTTAVSGSFGGESYSGSVSVDLKHLTQSEAAGLGLACPSDPCQHLIFARATGNFASGVGSGRRIIQIIVQGGFNSVGQGLIAGAPAAGSLQGNAEIHGSLHIVPCGTAPSCNTVLFSGGAGIRNNYNGLDGDRQKVIPLLPLVTCPLGTACAGQTVETLGGRTRIAYPQSPTAAIDIQSNAITVGESGSGSSNSYPGHSGIGKPTMDGVFLGSGCAPWISPACSDAVASRPQNVFSDRPIQAYDQSPPPTFPMLDDAAKVFSRDYDDYAACSGPGVCNANGDVVSGTAGNKDFFISHAFVIDSTTTEDATGCPTPGSCTRDLLDILGKHNGHAWNATEDGFSTTFKCGVGLVTCDDADGNRVNGSVNGSKPPGFQLEWNSNTLTMSVYQCPQNQPTTCEAASATAVAGAGVDPGLRRYRVTFVDGAGAESVPALPSNYVKILTSGSNKNIAVTIPLGPPGTVSRRVYRTKDGPTNEYYLVRTIPDNTTTSLSPADSMNDAALVTQGPTGLLSHPTDPVLPVLVYVDDRLKICENCTNKIFFFRGYAAWIAKGTTSDITGDQPSIAIDSPLLGCGPDGSSPLKCIAADEDHRAFPQRNLFTFYTPGNIFMGLQAQADFMGQFYAGNKWKSTKQTNVLGGVTARIFDMTAQVPRFWEVAMPFIQTAFPPRGPRWTLLRVRWKECLGTPPPGAC